MIDYVLMSEPQETYISPGFVKCNLISEMQWKFKQISLRYLNLFKNVIYIFLRFCNERPSITLCFSEMSFYPRILLS